MEILRGVTFHQKKSAVSLGKFDGIHLGHQLLMNEIIKQDEDRAGKFALFGSGKTIFVRADGD